MNLIDTAARTFLRRARVLSRRPIARQVEHLTIGGPELEGLPFVPGQHLRVRVAHGGAAAFGGMVRTYSIWNYEPASGTIDLAICTHSNGPGARWVRRLEAGDEILFSGPKGKFTVEDFAGVQLMIGDVSSLAHLYQIRRGLGPHRSVHGIIFLEGSQESFADLDGSQPFEFVRLKGDPVLSLMRRIATTESLLNSTPGLVYLGGEGRICIRLQSYFRDALGWPRRQVKAKPFWLPGRKGMD